MPQQPDKDMDVTQCGDVANPLNPPACSRGSARHLAYVAVAIVLRVLLDSADAH